MVDGLPIQLFGKLRPKPYDPFDGQVDYFLYINIGKISTKNRKNSPIIYAPPNGAIMIGIL